MNFKIPLPINQPPIPEKTPVIANDCRVANSEPATTDPIPDCHPAAMEPVLC